MTSLSDAIVAARQNNPGAYSNVSSNYLLGLLQQGKITPSQVGSVSTTVYGSPNTLQAIANFISGKTSVVSGVDTSASKGTSAGPAPPSTIQSPGSLGTAFSSGLSSAGNFFKQNPAALLIGSVVILAVVLKR